MAVSKKALEDRDKLLSATMYALADLRQEKSQIEKRVKEVNAQAMTMMIGHGLYETGWDDGELTLVVQKGENKSINEGRVITELMNFGLDADEIATFLKKVTDVKPFDWVRVGKVKIEEQEDE